VRVAIASPFPPLTSGIADYAAELLPALAAAGLEVTAYHEGTEAPPPGRLGGIEARPMRALAGLAGEHDRIVYQLGNSAPHHAQIYRELLRTPGVVVLHEFMLHHLVKALTLDVGRGEEFVEEMRYATGPSGEAAARRLLDTHRPLDVWSYPLFERVVDRSRAVLVHSEFARRRILASRAAANVLRVPFPVDLAAVERERILLGADRDRARAALGLAPGDFVIASFGFVTPFKRLEPALGAFARLREQLPEARFLVCGEVSPHYDLDGVIRERAAEGVRVTGRLSLESFHAAMTACDLAVNLRFPTGGETSASLLRLLAFGVPTVVSDLGSFAEIPEGAVARVPIDETEEEHLFALFSRLARDPDLRRALGEAGHRHVEAEHALDVAAAAFAEAVRRVGDGEVLAAAPPLAAPLPADPAWRLAASVGSDLAELGVDERDREGLASVAELLAELGWAPPRSAAR